MMFYGQNVAAFKLPWSVDTPAIYSECQTLEESMLIHNMHLGEINWLGAPLKAPLGDWKNTDATVFRHNPEMEKFGAPDSWEARKSYMARWQWTELCSWTPKTMEALLPLQGWGSFLNAVRFLKLQPQSEVDWHSDNTPGKEFRITLGLSGMEQEVWQIDTGYGVRDIAMKAGELWFVDIALKHRVVNRGTKPRYRLALQFYGPPTDALMKLYRETSDQNIVFARQYDFRPPFREF